MHRALSAVMIFSAALLFAVPAQALPPAEAALMAETGKAVVARLTNSREAAMAICEASRGLITPASPKYLAFYPERCLATFAEEGGVMGGARCPHYASAIATWTVSPPPIDRSDEDAALDRARFLRQIKSDYAAYCGANPPGPLKFDANAMLMVPMSGAVLRTQEGLSYALPAGFGVRSFDPITGAANMRNPITNADLNVARQNRNTGYTAEHGYADKETVAPGVELEWEYVDFLPGVSSYVMHGRVALPTAYISINLGNLKAAAGIDKTEGLAAMRTIAKSVKVTGPRLCIGECKAGSLVKGK